MKIISTAGLLSGYTGIVMSSLDDIYDVMETATGTEGLFTHHMPAAFDAAKPVLDAQFPWLANLEVPERGEDEERDDWVERIQVFVQTVVGDYGPTQDVRTPAEIGMTDFVFTPPTLASMMRPDREVIAVVVD